MLSYWLPFIVQQPSQGSQGLVVAYVALALDCILFSCMLTQDALANVS